MIKQAIQGVLEMDVRILNYVEKDKLEAYKRELKPNEIKDIYKDDNIRISLWKKGKRIFTFIDEFGTKKLNKALNEMYNLV